MRIFLPLVFLSCFALTAFGQDYMFVVYSTKGSVSLVENKAESKAKIGTIVGNNSTVKVGAGSFATLICNETRMFTLKKAGNYSMNSLQDSCKQDKTSSVSANYLKYIWNELTRSKGSPEKNRKAFMSNVGAVSRSINNVWIDPKLDTLNYVSGSIPLSWKSYTDADDFEFKVYKEVSGKPILTKLVRKKHVVVSDLLNSIKPGNEYYWTSMVKGETNDELKYLRYWTKDAYTDYLNDLKAGDASENEAEKNFRLGFLLEEAHFLAEAYQHYLKATTLAPTVFLYRSTYMSFKKDYEIK